MTLPPRTLLLDLDGTLVDSAPGILASCKAALEGLGHDAGGLEVRSVIGPPLEVMMAQLLARFGDDRVTEGVLAYREHYGAVGYLATTAYPGVAQALERLAEMNTHLYLATAKRTVFAERILERLGLTPHFAGVHGSEPGGAVDRKADLIAHLIGRYDLPPGRCLMVGDRREDMLGALANGVSPVGVLWGYGDRDELVSAGAGQTIAHPLELIPLVECG